jgi:hypothetical protein
MILSPLRPKAPQLRKRNYLGKIIPSCLCALVVPLIFFCGAKKPVERDQQVLLMSVKR